MAENDALLTAEQLQDLLLESPGFTEFLLGLTPISASLLGRETPLLCAIIVERETGPVTVASSTETARTLDERRYAFDTGPCLTALREQRTDLIRDLQADESWAWYAGAVADEGIRTILAVPIPTDNGSPDPAPGNRGAPFGPIPGAFEVGAAVPGRCGLGRGPD